MILVATSRITSWGRVRSQYLPARRRRELFTRMRKQLGQRTIYFEVREAGEIIDLD
jgi:hypothetical protein